MILSAKMWGEKKFVHDTLCRLGTINNQCDKNGDRCTIYCTRIDGISGYLFSLF